MHGGIAFVAAIVSSVSFGLAAVAEQKGALEAAASDDPLFIRIRAILQNTWYAGGVLLDGVGYAGFIVAVRSLPLFFVQAVGTASILITALVAHLWLQARLTKRDYGWIGMILFGLLILSVVTGPDSTVQLSTTTQHMLQFGSATVAIVALLAAKLMATKPILLSVLSGLCFSAVVVLTRMVQTPKHWALLLLEPTIYLIIVNGILGLALFTAALQRGTVAVVYSTNFVTETVLPTICGLMLFGDRPLHGRWVLLIIGLLVTTISAAALTRGKDYLQRG